MAKQIRGWWWGIALLAGTSGVEAQSTMRDEVMDREMDDAIDIIQTRFMKEMTHQQIVERALKALLADLDPYSKYLTPQERALFENDMSASFGGLGLNLYFEDPSGEPVVKYLMVESPGGRAGLQRGDRIVRIDGKPTKGASPDRVISWMRGPPGTPVRLELAGMESGAIRSMQAVRQTIHTPSVRGHRRDGDGRAIYMLDPDKRIGYIRIGSFADDTVASVGNALQALRRQGMRGLVLDLRDSIGGKMKAALGSADLFIDKGSLLAVRERDELETHDAKPGEYTDFPIALLVNGNTVSSAEIMVGAMKDSGRAVLVGQRTFGKGRVQEYIKLGDGRGALILSSGTFQRPSGKTIDRHDVPEGSTDAGIAPDIEVVVEGKEYEAWIAHASLLDSAVVLTDDEQKSPMLDRMLDIAVQKLIDDGKSD